MDLNVLATVFTKPCLPASRKTALSVWAALVSLLQTVKNESHHK